MLIVPGSSHYHFSKKVLADATIHNAMSMIELPSFTMSEFRAAKIGANLQFWKTMKENQFNAVYICLQHSAGIPERREVDGCSRTNPMNWIPTDMIEQYASQSDESFEEQKGQLT